MGKKAAVATRSIYREGFRKADIAATLSAFDQQTFTDKQIIVHFLSFQEFSKPAMTNIGLR